MNKQEIIARYPKEQDRLLVARIIDDIQFCKTRHQVRTTNFLDLSQKNQLEKLMRCLDYKNYLLWGGHEDAQRNLILFYPEIMEEYFMKQELNKQVKILEILLPRNLHGKYSHKDYLGGLMKLGIKREKIGDIVVWEEGAHVILKKEVVRFFEDNLSSLIRFRKAKITIKSIEELHESTVKKITKGIIIASMRLDNIVSELSKTSRSKATELIKQERVLINDQIETKNSKSVIIGDYITIRGKGKFEIIKEVGTTKKGRKLIQIETYE